jgi:hypothetical protein
MRYVLIVVTMLIVSISALAEEDEVNTDAKSLSGMSVLGNNEAPKALVIVPWKSSQIGNGIGVVESLSNRPMPIDREVFARELEYYLIRSEGTVPDDTVVKTAH